MKKIVYLLFAFSFANANVYNYGPWIPGTESVFRFESKIPYDYPDGLGIKSTVHVQAFADHTLRIKFEGSEIVQKPNGTLDLPKDPKPNAALDLPDWVCMVPIVAKDFILYLEQTLVVQLKQGHVKRFFVSRKEPKAVTDIKKSFLSLISADLSDSSNTALKSTPNRSMIELLGKEAISARLPPTHTKTREEISLVPSSYETTSSGLCCKMLEISDVGDNGDNFGIYVYHSTYNGRYTYKHVNKEYYLYRVSGTYYHAWYDALYSFNSWLVSGQIGSISGSIQHLSCTSHTCPEDCDSKWQLTCGWRPDPKLVVKCLKGCVDDLNGYKGYDCSTYEHYCRDSYTGDWYNRFRAACKNSCSRYASAYCNAVTCTDTCSHCYPRAGGKSCKKWGSDCRDSGWFCSTTPVSSTSDDYDICYPIGCDDEYLGYDNVTKSDGYDCNDYKKQCQSDYVSEWAKNVRASCKNTCDIFASEYCHLNTCKELSTTEKCCRNYNVPSQCVPLCAPTDEVSVWSKTYDDNLLRYCARFWNEIRQCKKGTPNLTQRTKSPRNESN